MPSDTARVRVESVTVGPFRENSYLVVDEAAGEAVLVDPGDEPSRILELLARSRARLTGIWLTHAHVDHIGGIAGVKRAYDVPVHLHAADRPLYDMQASFAAAYGLAFEPPPPPDAELAHDGAVRVGTTTWRVLHTPGHAPGHVIFHAPGIILAGDLLFAGSVGRTDLPLSDATRMAASLQTIAALPPASVVYPGHGPPTTIARERRDNPFLNGTAHVRRDAT